MLATNTAAQVEKLVHDTITNRSLSGNLLPLNNNESFVDLEGVSTVTVVAEAAEKSAKKGGAVPVAFGLVNRCSCNQLYCSFVVTAPKYEGGYVKVDPIKGGGGGGGEEVLTSGKEDDEDALYEKKQQHTVLRITEVVEKLPNLSGLPQYFSAFCEPEARPLLQCVMDQLVEQTVGHAEVETRRNITVDIYDSPVEGVDSSKLWRDLSGFVVDDRFRYREIEIKRDALLGVMKAATATLTPPPPPQDSPAFRVEKLTKANFDALCDYDQTVAVMNRTQYLEYLFGLYGIAGSVALDEQNQAVGYVLSLNDHLLQCYAEDEGIASALLIEHVEKCMQQAKVTMFVRLDGEWIGEELVERAVSTRPVRRFHSRMVPNSVKWRKVFAYAIGLHIF